MIVFNQDRREYYRAKKRELNRIKQSQQTIKDDAMIVHYYGMDAFMSLFPESKYLGVSYHNELVAELRKIKNNDLANLLSGIYLANAAVKSKKANRKLRRIIKTLTN